MVQLDEYGRTGQQADQVNVSIVLANAGAAHSLLDSALGSTDAQDVQRNLDTARRILAAIDPVLAQIEAGTHSLNHAAAAKIQLHERLREIERIVSQ